MLAQIVEADTRVPAAGGADCLLPPFEKPAIHVRKKVTVSALSAGPGAISTYPPMQRVGLAAGGWKMEVKSGQ